MAPGGGLHARRAVLGDTCVAPTLGWVSDLLAPRARKGRNQSAGVGAAFGKALFSERWGLWPRPPKSPFQEMVRKDGSRRPKLSPPRYRKQTTNQDSTRTSPSARALSELTRIYVTFKHKDDDGEKARSNLSERAEGNLS